MRKDATVPNGMIQAGPSDDGASADRLVAIDATNERETERFPHMLDFPVVGVGASAGGLEALSEMFAAAQVPLDMAFVAVLHLDPDHESLMAEIVDRRTPLEVRQLVDGERPEAGTVLIIPPGHGLEISEGLLRLTPVAAQRGLRRPIDDFFASLARDQGDNAAGVVLSGTGADGSVGLRTLKEHGALCIAQEPSSARYDGMPGAAIATGVIDFTEPAEALVGRLRRYFAVRVAPGHGAQRGANHRAGSPAIASADIADHLDAICALLHERIGHDFQHYKRTTMVRRSERRMHVLGMVDAAAYLARLRDDDEECRALFRDLLINVTSFFRDAEAFQALARRAIEPIIASAAVPDPIRIWVAGCSSGEEAFSIAMLCDDAAERAGVDPLVQIFATDIDEQMLSLAREAVYPASVMGDIPEAFRARYMVSHGQRVQVVERIRDMVRFSAHSLVRDPGFSRLDLISCRNLFIYLDADAQASLVPLMHYALKPGGFLFLGSSENIGQRDDLFANIDLRARLFRRRDTPASYPLRLPSDGTRVGRRPPSRRPDQDRAMPALSDPAAGRLFEAYSPPAVVVAADGTITAGFGRLAKYLLAFNSGFGSSGFGGGASGSGGLGTNIVDAARPGLREVAGELIASATRQGRRVAQREVEVVSEFGVQPIDLIADPLGDGSVMLVLIEAGRFRQELKDSYEDIGPGEERVLRLERELGRLRHELKTTTEELETANEEQKSSNEEMMSMNEELQSTNEELTTVNDELKSKVDLLAIANDTLRNFFESTELAVIVVDRELRLRSYTNKARGIFPLNQADQGRKLGEITSLLDDPRLIEDTVAVIAGGQALERLSRARRSATDEAGGTRDLQTYKLRIVPYRTVNNSIDGATLIFADVSDMQAAQDQLLADQQRLQLALSVGSTGVIEYDPATGIATPDTAMCVMLSLPKRATHTLDEITAQIVPSEREAVQRTLVRAIESGEDFTGAFRVGRSEDSQRWLQGMGRSLLRASGRSSFVLVFHDVSETRAASEAQALLAREMNHRVKNVFAVVLALVTLAAREAASVDDLTREVGSRLIALSRAHEITQGTVAGEAPADLSSLVGTVLDAHRHDDRMTIDGPVVQLPYAAITPLGLILYEWATNAAKYGALSIEGGTVRVEWTLEPPQAEDRPLVALTWIETLPSPSLTSIGQRGFGSRLVGTSARQMQARLETAFMPQGFRAELVFPI